MKELMSLIICVAFACSLQAQRLSHVQGEIMFAIGKNQKPYTVDRYLNGFSGGEVNAKYEQVCAAPMNIWLMKFDHNRINEIHLKDYVHELPMVQGAQFNHITSLRAEPNDPEFAQQWQYINTGQDGGTVGADMDMELAWDKATGGVTPLGDTIVVCVVDDGVDTTHPDMVDNLWKNYAEIPGNGIDDDNNGYVDDYAGWDTGTDTDNIGVGAVHGTPVAGIVGAKGNNGIGVAGVNWDVKLMIVKGGSPESRAIASYSYAYEHRKRYNETNGEQGAFVVATNSSWGVDYGKAEDAPLWCSFYDSLGMAGILNFGATINGNVNVDEQGDLPTTCEGDFIVGVTNLNRNDDKVIGAGYGAKHIDLGAYGAEAYTARKGGGYGGFGGTSGATPHVAGVAALIYSMDCSRLAETARTQPDAAALAVRNFILDGVTPLQSLEGITVTGGKLNANMALNNALNLCADCPYPVDLVKESATPFSISLKWGAVSEAQNYNLKYRKVGTAEWTDIMQVSSPHTVDGLEACSMYEFQIASNCNGTAGNYSFVRSFSTEGCCILPSNLSASYSDAGQLTFSWDAYQYASDYVLSYRLIGTSAWTDVTVTESTHAIPAAECQSYEYRIKSNCGEFSTESPVSDIRIINTACGVCTNESYCQFGAKDNTGEWIKKVQIAQLNNESEADPSGYGNYLGGATTTLAQGVSYDIRLEPGYAGTSYDEFFTVYIDHNLDGVFDQSELVFETAEDGQGPVDGIVTIPADANIGQTRMRVIMNFEHKIGPCDPGGNTSRYGETEDYCVEIVAAGNCNADLNVVFADSTDTSIDLNWSPVEAFSGYKLGIRKVGSEEYTDFNIAAATTYQFTGLEICTEYEYRISPACQLGQAPYQTGTVKTTCTSSTIQLSNGIKAGLINNPGIDQIFLSIKNANNKTAQIKTYSYNGQLVQSKNVTLEGTQTHIDMQAEQLNSGVYLVQLLIGDESHTFKMLKL